MKHVRPPMKLDIIQWPSDRLKEVSDEIDQDQIDSLGEFVDDMFYSMYLADGVGLSAIQVGVAFRLFIMDIDNEPIVCINPTIETVLGEAVLEDEGCLSAPGIYEKIKRYPQVVAAYTDMSGGLNIRTFVGVAAQCIQHEMEHLDGKFFLDHVSSLKRSRAAKTLKKRG